MLFFLQNFKFLSRYPRGSENSEHHCHPGLAEIPALDGGSGSDIINEGLKLLTIAVGEIS